MWVSVDVDADDVIREVDTDYLVEELERRGHDYNSRFADSDLALQQLTMIYEKRRLGKPFDEELDGLIYNVLGKII